MSDVHRLGDIGSSIVHHHMTERIGARRPQARIGNHLGEPPGQELIGQTDVDKPGSGREYLSEPVILPRAFGDRHRQAPGRLSRRARGCQCAVALKVSQLGALGGKHPAITPVKAHLFEDRAEHLPQEGNQGHRAASRIRP